MLRNGVGIGVVVLACVLFTFSGVQAAATNDASSQLSVENAVTATDSHDTSRSDSDGTNGARDCQCPFICDGNGDGQIDPVDKIIGYPIVWGYVVTQDPNCPTSRSDVNADGHLDLSDWCMWWDVLFLRMPFDSVPDPCACGFPCDPPQATGSGSVFVESKNAATNAEDTVGVYLSNTSALEGLLVLLVIREIDIYPVALNMVETPEGRLATKFLTGGRPIEGFDEMVGDCGGGPNTGFGGTPGGVGLTSPDALRYLRYEVYPADSLPSGSDTIPSLGIVFTAPNAPGQFEIDTTCHNPENHLVFVEAGSHGLITPSFTKGIITVDCDCPYQCDFNADHIRDAVDLNELINVLYFNSPDPQDPFCALTRGDFDGNGVSDSVDLNALIQHLFFNGPLPADPCAVPE